MTDINVETDTIRFVVEKDIIETVYGRNGLINMLRTFFCRNIHIKLDLHTETVIIISAFCTHRHNK